MICTNCGQKIPDTAKICGHCGHRLKSALASTPLQTVQSVPMVSPRGTPGWVWGLIGSIGALAGILIFGIFTWLKPGVPDSAPPVVDPPQVVVAPVEKINTPEIFPSATPTSTPLPSPTPTKTNLRCNLFKGMNMSVVWLDSAKGSTQFQFYVKMPGGVPGLEKEIAGQTGDWEYEVKIGDYSTAACYVIQGYKNRLYCDFQMPSGYDATVRPMELYVNECSKPIYEDELCELPSLRGMGGGGGGSGTGTGSTACSSGLGPSECGAAGGTYHTTFCTVPPCPAWCSCP